MNVVQKNGLEMMPDNKRNEDQFPLLVSLTSSLNSSLSESSATPDGCTNLSLQKSSEISDSFFGDTETFNKTYILKINMIKCEQFQWESKNTEEIMFRR